jgi:hypothetical protein
VQGPGCVRVSCFASQLLKFFPEEDLDQDALPGRVVVAPVHVLTLLRHDLKWLPSNLIPEPPNEKEPARPLALRVQ